MDSRAFNIDLRGPRFWYNSYFIVTKNVQDLKCVPEKLQCDFLGRGQNPKVQIAKKNLKDILNNVESNYKAQAIATFSISALISEIWTFKDKKC